jgi:hypothetical protein
MDVSQWDKQLQRKARSWNESVPEYLTELRQYAAGFIRPHVEGPISDDEAKKPSEFSCHFLDIGDGLHIYREMTYTLPRDVELAIAAIHQIRLVEIHCGLDGEGCHLNQKRRRLPS